MPTTRPILILAVSMLLSACGAFPTQPPPATVERVDIERYLGDWYEIARIPNSFQDMCRSDVVATYTRDGEGYDLSVVNRCRTANNVLEEAYGKADIVEGSNNTKLEVSFFSLLGWRPFWGDYWIIGLDENYEWVVIGSPDRDYGWILSRTPTLEPGTRAQIDSLLKEKAYVPSEFVDTPQVW